MSPDHPRKVAPEVSELELPGIGRRFDLDHLDGGRITVVIHHSGRRDLYLLPSDEDEPNAVMTLTDRQARSLGAVLGGAYFKPAMVEEIEEVIGNLLIDWVTLPGSSPAVGRTIGELEIRKRTRMTVVAIVRFTRSARPACSRCAASAWGRPPMRTPETVVLRGTLSPAT